MKIWVEIWVDKFPRSLKWVKFHLLWIFPFSSWSTQAGAFLSHWHVNSRKEETNSQASPCLLFHWLILVAGPLNRIIKIKRSEPQSLPEYLTQVKLSGRSWNWHLNPSSSAQIKNLVAGGWRSKDYSHSTPWHFHSIAQEAIPII